MTERYGHWNTYIEGPRFSEFKSFLYDLSYKHHCELVIKNQETKIFTERIDFKFSGFETNLLNLKLEFTKKLEIFNSEQFISDSYKVNKVVIDTSLNHLNKLKFDIYANKFSSVKTLPEKLADNLDLDISITEESKGLFKGKQISFILSGKQKDLNSFKKIFSNHIKSEIPITEGTYALENSRKIKVH
jgi:hypothetical protein